ncbi:hypothetical protein CspHIS471_0300370 [Cutaneotrichosporon sp. HIS471]|nr:hypothetical protein CspHIS471_0300370 [Cutaneotrichosporon sp. HIS471]
MDKQEIQHIHNAEQERAHDRAMGREDTGSFMGNLKTQIETWHSNRGDRSVAASIIPVPGRNRTQDTPTNPFKVLSRMTPLAYACFFAGWLAWFCDGYDYFSVPITLTDLAKEFDKTHADIAWALTVTTLVRVSGAVFFGILADQYGRRYTLTINMLLVCVFELATGFVKTYQQFLGLRAAYGVAMGGTYALAVATALENIPFEARGLVSGILQQGYAIGNLLAAVIGMTTGQTSKYHWRTLFFFGGGFSLLAAIVRFSIPESAQFKLAREEARAQQLSNKDQAKHFWHELRAMLRTNWLRCAWCVFVMAGFCFLAHASQDMYTTYLKVTKKISPVDANKISIISNCGAIVGGTLGGNFSQFIGRRASILISIIWTAAFIPLWILPHSFGGLAAGGFFMQWGVQSAWGVVPVYLSEVSPPAFRALFLGLFYQLGNMASGASGTIEAVAGEHRKLPGTNTPDYATIQGIFVGVILAFVTICIIFGPEADAAHFELAKVAIQDGAGEAHMSDYIAEEDKHHSKHRVENVERKDSHATSFV